jgi:hypothetical protein
MGHKYLKTTAQYIHLDNQHFTKITNPSDRIEAWEKLTQSVLQKGINSEKFSANSATVLSKNIAPPVSYVEPLKTSKNAEPKPSVD